MTTMLKQLGLSALENKWLTRALEQLGRGGYLVLFMHRFAEDAERFGRHDPAKLRSVLDRLHKAGATFVPLEQVMSVLSGATAGDRKLAVSFTVDDGYADFAELGWPVFREFDCPVSLFVSPGVMSGDHWFWWDRLRWIMEHAEQPSIALEAEGARYLAQWIDEPSRHAVFEQACEWLKFRSTSELHEALRAYADWVGVSVPLIPPRHDRVLGWSELRQLERDGLRVGAHTMTHPILSRCTDTQAEWEIAESVRLVNANMERPLPVFAYPNGRPDDHGPREWQALREAQVPFAVTTVGGKLESTGWPSAGGNASYCLPRTSYRSQAGQIIREFLR
jgi:peptidoglycan/xylan/chitin deacetylase (PgdA/CDA1 family)